MSAETSATAPQPSRVSRAHWRWVFLAVGIALLAYVIRTVGPARILATLIGASVFMPLIIAGDLAFFICETFAYRAVLGPKVDSIPSGFFARTALLYYCVMVLAPLGRMGAEIARAAALSSHVGAGPVTAAATNMQGGVLLANCFVSVPALVAVIHVVGIDHPLSWLLTINAVGTGVLGLVTLLIVRKSRIGGWLGRRIPRLAALGADLDASAVVDRSRLVRSVAFCFAARLAQIAQYAALLAAVGATVTLGGSLVAFGVHLAGAAFGDLVPNQIGIMEGAYQIFADAIGMADDPARAVSIALLSRVSQIVIASTSMFVMAFSKAGTAPSTTP